MEPVLNATLSQESVKANGGSQPSSALQGPRASVLTEEMLVRFATRAVNYDRENRFFKEDFDELKAADYLRSAVPSEKHPRHTLRSRRSRLQHALPRRPAAAAASAAAERQKSGAR